MILKIATLAIAAFMYPQTDSNPQSTADPTPVITEQTPAAEDFHKNHNTDGNILRPRRTPGNSIYSQSVAQAHIDAHRRALQSQILH